MVNSGEIPYTDMQLAGITSGAESLRTVASAVRDGTADIVTAWGKISGSYEGPSDEQLFAVMTPIGPQGTTFGDDLDTAAKALDTFVEEVTPIVAALKKYVARAAKLKKDISAFQPVTTQTMDGPVTTTETWDQDETLNGENNDIINGVANRVVEYQAAERKCANAIRALNGLPALHSITGSGNDDLGYGYDELPMGTKLPWGTAESRNESCAEKTGMFLPHLVKGVVWDGVVVGFFGGLGTMIGFKDWKWSGDNFVEAWKGMAPLLGYDKEKDEWWSGDAFWSSLGDVGKGFVAWDKWSEDPGTALGETSWNIVSTFIPFLGVASKFGKFGTVASAVSKADKVVEALDIGAWASRGLTKVLPKLGDLKNVLVNGVGNMAERFTGTLADFKVQLGDWMHRHHSESDGSAGADQASTRSEAEADARAGVDAQANANGGEPSVHVEEREPALVGGGSGETAVVHGGGRDSAPGAGGGQGTDAGHHGGGDQDDPRAEPGDARADGAAPRQYSEISVDSAGTDIAPFVRQSGLTPETLHDYLRAQWPNGAVLADRFEATGIWPHDVQIPKSPVFVRPDGEIDWSGVPHDGFELDASNQPIDVAHSPKVGEVFDRYGPENGRFTSPVHETGPYPYSARSLPYIEDATQYHQYRVVKDFDQIHEAVMAAPSEVRQDVLDLMETRDLTWGDLASGLRGKIAAGFGDPGGGVQMQMPLTINVLREIGMIERI